MKKETMTKLNLHTKRGHDFLTQNHIESPNGMRTMAMVDQEEWGPDTESP